MPITELGKQLILMLVKGEVIKNKIKKVDAWGNRLVNN